MYEKCERKPGKTVCFGGLVEHGCASERLYCPGDIEADGPERLMHMGLIDVKKQ